MPRPLRFCMVTTFYPPYNFGGDGIFIRALAGELAQRGHEVEVIHCADSYRLLAGHDPTGGYDNLPGVTVHGLHSPVGPLSPLATQQTGLPLFKTKAIEQILARGFDVIHFHNVSLIGGPGVLRLGRGLKLYTMHEYWLVCPMHTLFKYNREACTRPNCTVCSLSYGRPPQPWRYTGLLADAARHVDAFISPSRFSQGVHQRLSLPSPIVYLPNFVPDLTPAAGARPRPAPAHEAPAPYFLFVGRLEKLKGLHTLLPIFRRWRKARLLVAGAGSQFEALRQLAGDDPNIEFLGSQSPTQLQNLYQDALAVVVPSVCFEMFPLVILEAFRQGTPVIARNLGGLPEIVHEAGGGKVYDTDDELIAALDQLAGSPVCRDELGQRGHAAYRAKWTTEAHLAGYLEIVRQAASRRGLDLERRFDR